MDDEITKILEKLEAKITALEVKVKKNETDTIGFIDDHGERHLELNKMIYPSYFKTHPEFCKSMDQFDVIVGAKKNGEDTPRK